MKTYLISGIFEYHNSEQRPFRCTTALAPGECMDEEMLTSLEEIIRKQNNKTKTIARLATIHSFQLLETTPPVPPAEVHLNDCSVVMPPVDSPLLIEIAPGVLVRASRPAHAQSRDDYMRFDIMNGKDGWYIGRPRWTHP